MSIYKVREFNEKFGLPNGERDELTRNSEAIEFRVRFLQEELDELREALDKGDRVRAFDALLDLAYVTYGTALFMGVSPIQWDLGMLHVHRANMSKERAQSSDDSKRGTTLDVVKPAGWQGPETGLEEVLSWTQADD